MKYAPTTYPHWEAPELGMVRATGASLVVFAFIMAGIYLLIPVRHRPPPPLVTHARMVTLPPPPPPPPEVVQPPEPLQPPPITPPPEAPTPARIQIQKPPPKPVKRVVRHPTHRKIEPPQPPQPQIQAPRVTNPPPPSPVQRGTDMTEYGQEVHDQIQAAIEIPTQIQQLGLSGTATIACVVSPDGRLVSARVSRSSGNPLIDRAALAGVRQHRFRPFVGQNTPFNIPIEITGSGEQ